MYSHKSLSSPSTHNRPKLVYDPKKRLLVAQEDIYYGVTTNEKSLKRGIKASNHIHSEVIELVQVRLLLFSSSKTNII